MDMVTIAAQLAAAGLDPRMAGARADLADVALQGVVTAARYAEPVVMACAVRFTPLFDSPGGEQVSELLAGEHFMQLETQGGWTWGFCAHDHYIGYCRADALVEACDPAPVAHASDPVTFAQQFLDMPYVWGGRGGAGIDCSGLVQRSMAAVGVAALRDSDMQRETLGELLPGDAALQRGDVIFFPGHVGLMVDGEQLIHATRYYMKTLVEPLDFVVARVVRKHAMGILARRRVSW
jgi:NlpC/P60 family/Bacterial dipeptidyl-peptidase Sh3 domain